MEPSALHARGSRPVDLSGRDRSSIQARDRWHADGGVNANRRPASPGRPLVYFRLPCMPGRTPPSPCAASLRFASGVPSLSLFPAVETGEAQETDVLALLLHARRIRHVSTARVVSCRCSTNRLVRA
jgi:hypothetical protein